MEKNKLRVALVNVVTDGKKKPEVATTSGGGKEAEAVSKKQDVGDSDNDQEMCNKPISQ